MRSLWAFLLLAAIGANAEELPALAPVVDSVFPHGIGKGQTTEIELRGQHLKNASGVKFFGEGVSAEVLSTSESKVKLRVNARADAEAGRREFRFKTPLGSYIGVLDVSTLPEIFEVEPNDDWRKPQKITLPILVNGVIKSEDWDHYSFHAEAGETLVFEVNAARSGSRLDADLALLDSKGNEIVWNDDYTIYGDPHIEYTFAKSGDYVIRVGSLNGGNNSDYRFIAGRLPYVARSMPAGFGAGMATEMTLTGANLEGANAVWLGDHLAEGEVLRASPNEARIRITVPRGTKLGRYFLHVKTPLGETPIALFVMVSDVPEIIVAAPPLSLLSALPVSTPVVVNGVLDRPKGSHYFSFEAMAGQPFVLHCDGQNLYYHTDPTITVFDSNGKKLAFIDDPNTDDYSDEYQADPTMTFIAGKAGKYYVAVRDAMYRGGPDLIYRLSVTPVQPDFYVELFEPTKTSFLGQPDQLQVRVRRRGGWNTPIEVWAEGLPPGVTSGKVFIEPKDTIITDGCNAKLRPIDGSSAYLPMKIDSKDPGNYHYTIRARGTMDGRTVEHTAIVRYRKYAAGYIYGNAQFQEADLTLAPAPRITIAAPGSLTVPAGGTARLRVTLSRYLEAKNRPVLLNARSVATGLKIEPILAAPEEKDVILMVTASIDAVGESSLIVEATPEPGGEGGQSAPISIKVEKKKGS